jgi:pyruvate dehydrogenase E1 component beta subunit
MATNILMPALSPTMEQGKLAKWLKKEGDAIKAGDVIAEIETDKATMEVEAVDEGTLAKILVADGTDNVAVNTPIGVITADGEDASSVPSPKAAESAPAGASAAAAPPEPQKAPTAPTVQAAPPTA